MTVSNTLQENKTGYTEAEVYAASLREMASWVRKHGETTFVYDGDPDELDAAADLIVSLKSRVEELEGALRKAGDAMFEIRKCSIAGAVEGYSKPELWSEALFVSHGDVAASLKSIAAALQTSQVKP
jgi:hypothetical protein